MSKMYNRLHILLFENCFLLFCRKDCEIVQKINRKGKKVQTNALFGQMMIEKYKYLCSVFHGKTRKPGTYHTHPNTNNN